LRASGFTVLSIQESHSAITDTQVLKLAEDNLALLITEDKDFGELVFRFQLKHTGILLLRMEQDKDMILLATRAITRFYKELLGKFSVLDKIKLRIKD
jgi:predicted nuclease of predicted toxin-antitoxin system